MRQDAIRAGRGIDTYFAELERLLPNIDELSLKASLGLSKAYDTTWWHGILRALKSWRIRGWMINMAHSFLSERTFHRLENGSVLSVTLFLVVMQHFFELYQLESKFFYSRRHPSCSSCSETSNKLRAVEKWSKLVGSTISATKSHRIYCSTNARREPPKVTIAVPKTNRLRILSITLDRTHTIKPHCQATKKA